MTRAEWFMALASLAFPADSARAQAAFVPMMAMMSDMPDAAFTRSSLEHVVTSPRKMAIPSYDEIRRPLAAWWRDNRPAEQRMQSEYPALPGPAAGESRVPSEIEKNAVSEMVRAFKASTGIKRSAALTPEAERPTPRPLNDLQLLAEYEALARAENPLARTRVEMLRQRLGADAEVSL